MSRKSTPSKLPHIEEQEGDTINELKENVKFLKSNLESIKGYLHNQEAELNDVIEKIKTTRESGRTNSFVILKMLAGRVRSLKENIDSTLRNKKSVNSTLFYQEKKIKKYTGTAASAPVDHDYDAAAGVFQETTSSNRCLYCIRNPRQCDVCKEADRIESYLREAVVIAKEAEAQADTQEKAAASVAKSSQQRSQSPDRKGCWPFSRKCFGKRNASQHGGRKYKTRKLNPRNRYNQRGLSRK